MQNQIAPMPETNAVATPNASTRECPEGAASSSGSVQTAAPEIAATLIRNENSAAANGATPSASAAASVRPLRETPGRIAIACAQPIQKAVHQLGSALARGRAGRARGPEHGAGDQQADAGGPGGLELRLEEIAEGQRRRPPRAASRPPACRRSAARRSARVSTPRTSSITRSR